MKENKKTKTFPTISIWVCLFSREISGSTKKSETLSAELTLADAKESDS